MWPAPKFISVNGPVKELAVYDTGEDPGKPVIFFIHGLAIHSGIWKYAFDQLQNKFRCIAMDLPGHGLSWKERGNFSMSFYAQSVRACIETLKLNDIILAGHSMGGQISIILSLQIPAIVQRIALICSAGIERFTAEEGQKIVQGAEYFYRAPMDVAHLLSVYQPHLGKHAERLSELAENHLTQQRENFSAFSETVIASVKGMIAEPVNHYLSHVHQPCLVLYGENDKLIPNKWVHPVMNIQTVADEARQNLRHATVRVLPDCGHYLPIENAVRMAEELEKFCAV